jgi:hypothetical protein
MAAGTIERTLTKLEKADDFTVAETFADALDSFIAADGCVYLTFAVRRSENVEDNVPPRIKQVTCARLVLTVPAAAALHAQLGRMFARMEREGTIRRRPEQVKSLQ